MRSAAVLALLLCAGQVTALPVKTLMTKGETEVMKCIVEVITDTLSKPSPMPVSQECSETLRGDERILSILRHQNLLRELQDLALQGTQERAQQQKKHSGEAQEKHGAEEAPPTEAKKQSVQALLKDETAATPPKEASPLGSAPALPAQERGASSEEVEADGDRPQTTLKPTQGSREQDEQTPGKKEVPPTQPPASRPNLRRPEPQAEGHNEEHSRGPARTKETEREEEEEEEEEVVEAGEKARSEEEAAAAGERARSEEESLSTALITPPRASKEVMSRDGAPEAPTMGEAGGMQARPLERKGVQKYSQQQEEEALTGSLHTLLPGGRSSQLEPKEEEEEEEGQRAKQWTGTKRWSKMDRLAEELAAEKREEPAQTDRSMKLSYKLGGHGPAPDWHPSPWEDSVEAGLPLRGHSFAEEKEEEGSTNRRAEDQELESLSAIEAELEKVAHELEALRRG